MKIALVGWVLGTFMTVGVAAAAPITQFFVSSAPAAPILKSYTMTSWMPTTPGSVGVCQIWEDEADRKSTRLNSSHRL